jgi:hypothetical protein
VHEWLCMQLKDFFMRNPGISEVLEDMYWTKQGLCCKMTKLYWTYIYILSRVLVTNNAGSGLDEWAYLLLIHTTSNYT